MTTYIRNLILTGAVLISPLFSMDHKHRHDHANHQSHAPISVMGDHYHEKGEFMLTYRAMQMNMDKNYQGSSSLTSREALQLGTAGPGPNGEYMMVPTEMTMRMQMLGLMYAVTSRLTLMVMANYTENDMDIEMLNGTKFSTKSSGISDTKLSALYGLKEWGNSRLHLGFGLSLPTGAIDKKDDTPSSAGVAIQLPYSMQLGSGTYDLEPALTMNHNIDSMPMSFGAQVSGTFRLGENDHDYTLGDAYKVVTWGAYDWTNSINNSLRLSWQQWDDIDGADSKLTVSKTMMPTADPDLRGGKRLELGLGLNFLGVKGTLEGQKLALEFSKTLYQNLNGPQLGVNDQWTIGYQKVW